MSGSSGLMEDYPVGVEPSEGYSFPTVELPEPTFPANHLRWIGIYI